MEMLKLHAVWPVKLKWDGFISWWVILRQYRSSSNDSETRWIKITTNDVLSSKCTWEWGIGRLARFNWEHILLHVIMTCEVVIWDFSHSGSGSSCDALGLYVWTNLRLWIKICPVSVVTIDPKTRRFERDLWRGYGYVSKSVSLLLYCE